jgi:cation diffusion facilitator CzcD-associated flavoprotein CzcO
VNLRQEPITSITATSIKTGKRSVDVDIIVFATGFDAMTGAVKAIHPITGRDGRSLNDEWSAPTHNPAWRLDNRGCCSAGVRAFDP